MTAYLLIAAFAIAAGRARVAVAGQGAQAAQAAGNLAH
jgi:hypothetical protein